MQKRTKSEVNAVENMIKNGNLLVAEPVAKEKRRGRGKSAKCDKESLPPTYLFYTIVKIAKQIIRAEICLRMLTCLGVMTFTRAKA